MRGPSRKPRCHGSGGPDSRADGRGAVEPDQRHDVGDGAERDEIEQRAEVRLRACDESTPLAQMRAQRAQHVEHHTDAGEVLRRKRAARLVRIDDHRRRRKRIARQVVIGDQHLDARGGGRTHPVDACDAVVDRDEETRPPARGP